MTTTAAAIESDRPSAQRRRLGARITDLLAGRLLGLPRPTSEYTVTRGVRVPMRDGVELVADHYAPVGPARGTILVRGPYGRAGADLAALRPHLRRSRLSRAAAELPRHVRLR